MGCKPCRRRRRLQLQGASWTVWYRVPPSCTSYPLDAHDSARYLSCDKFGLLGATREAISHEETFVCIPCPGAPGTFSIQTQRENFLTIADSKSSSSSAVEIRGDAEEITFNTTWRVRMQARFKPRLKANKEERAREKISRQQLEEAVGRRLDEDEVRRLKKARREGTYHEAILDVRVKGKHDKFAC